MGPGEQVVAVSPAAAVAEEEEWEVADPRTLVLNVNSRQLPKGFPTNPKAKASSVGPGNRKGAELTEYRGRNFGKEHQGISLI